MTNFSRSVLAASALTLMSSAGAFAADLYGGGSMKDSGRVEPTMTRPASIYLRGDFSAGRSDLGSITEAPNYTETTTSIGNSRMWGGGIGYYFSSSVRGDLTFDWSRTADVRGSIVDPAATVQGERQFGMKHMVGLANLYYDFDTRTRFTPYLGVGLGFARNTTTAGTVLTPTCAAACSVSMDGTSKTNAAGALMAGFSAKLADRWTMDAGYRFLYLGDAATSDLQIAGAVAPAPSSTPAVQVHDMYDHQVRVGLRMDLR